MTKQAKTNAVLLGLSVTFVALACAYFAKAWGRPTPLPPIHLVDSSITSNATARVSYGQLVAAKADFSDFDCYTCHDRNKPPQLRFDDKHNLIVPKDTRTS